MAGRKRKHGRREPSGRPQRETAQEVRQTVADARVRVYGVPVHLAYSERVGTAYGRMALDGRLIGRPVRTDVDRAEAEALARACDRLLEDYHAWRQATCAPPLDGSPPLERTDRDQTDRERVERDVAAERAWRDALAAMGGPYDERTTATRMLVCADVEVRDYYLLRARRGVEKLRDHYRTALDDARRV